MKLCSITNNSVMMLFYCADFFLVVFSVLAICAPHSKK